MGRAKNPTSLMNVAEQQNTVLAKRLSGLITDVSELKDYLGVSPQAINQYRLGVSRPSLENLCKIADFYKVSTDYLLGRTETKTTEEDIAVAVKTTGLSENAIEKLKGNGTAGAMEKQSELSRLIENRIFWDMIGQIRAYRQLCESAERLTFFSVENQKHLNAEQTQNIELLLNKHDDEKELSLFSAQKILFKLTADIEAEVKENAVDSEEGE